MLGSGAGSGVLHSVDGGKSWHLNTSFGSSKDHNLTMHDNYWYMAEDLVSDYIYKSSTINGPWEYIAPSFSLPISAAHMGEEHISPANSAIQFIFPNSYTLNRSIDAGVTWQPVALPEGNIQSLHFHLGNPNTIFIWDNKHLYKSTNFGDTWVQVIFPAAWYLNTLDDYRDGPYFTAASDTIYFLSKNNALQQYFVGVSTDECLTFTENYYDDSLSINEITTCVAKPNKIIGQDNSLMFFSNDAGLNWQNVNNPLGPGVSFQDIYFHPTDTNLVIAKMQNEGSFLGDIAVLVASAPSILEEIKYLSQPNSNGINILNNGQISYKCNTASLVQIFLYDVSGRRVKKLLNKIHKPGQYYTNYKDYKLSNGCYLVGMKVNNKSVAVKRVLHMK